MAKKIEKETMKDMTQGDPFKVILNFIIPMLLGNVFQQLYNVVDSIIIGRYVGANALAAVGASFPIIFLYVAIAIGLGVGGSVVMSQYYGAKNYDKLRVSISTTLIVQTVISIILSVIGFITAKPLLRLLNTPEEIIGQSVSYMKIYLFGLIFIFLYNTFTSIYRAIGDSKSPLYFLIIATIINVLLDLVFVIKFKMGVSGVAWATVIAQGASAFLCYIYSQIKIPLLKFKKEDLIYDKEMKNKILKIGIPAMIQQVIVSLGMMATQGLVNSYGAETIAGYTAATKIDNFATIPIMNLSIGVSTFTAQNIGANKPERIDSGFKVGILMVVFFSVFVTLLIFLFGKGLISIFVDSSSGKDVFEAGMLYLKVVSLFYVLFGIMFVCNGVLRGAGDMKMVTVSTMLSLAIRIISAYSLNGVLGFTTIAVAIPVGWVFGMSMSLIRVKRGEWKSKSVIE
ncbi:MAG: MATE family efflux transporter [Filifactoraceae bacterium]